MKKEEVIQLHVLMAQVKKFCEQHGLDCEFSTYRELNISPFQVHRSKDEHKQAVFVLLTALVSMTAKHNCPVPCHCLAFLHDQ
ncbi:MAG TPA: metal-binding protein [Methanomicrobia archaeon]|nr:metal-binding protein [Methanomicrobia archaeon]